MEWSPDGRVLASCSLDGTICFWNADPSSSQTLIGKIEQAHSGFIKGMSWDPAGKFLASQSDDGSCIVWNVESLLASQASSTAFTLDPSDCEMFKECVLEKIFVNMSKMTFFHRPGWSPDGSMLALANATNRHIPAVALVERSNWHGPGTYFVGHLGPVEAVRFSPRLFTGANDREKKEMICAVASQDGQVSLWSSSSSTPLLVLQDLFEHSVMDLTWTPDGNVLVAVSYDGAAVAIKIDSLEFDLVPLSESEQAEHLRNVFGNRSASSGDAVQGYVESAKVIECLRENEQFLSNHPPQKEVVDILRPLSPMTTIGFANNNVNVNANNNVASVQLPPTIVNGKKRITPQLLNTSSLGNNLQGNTPTGSLGNSQISRPGMRLRDEDFLIHRKLLERSSVILLGSNQIKSKENASVFSPLEVPSSLSVPLSSGSFLSVSLEITNHDVAGRKPSSLVQFIQSSQIAWKERFRGTIYIASGTRKYSALAISSESQKHSLLVLTASGRRHLPPIALDSQAIFLKLTMKEELVVISANGTICIWDLKACKLIFSDGSLGLYLEAPVVQLIDFRSEDLLIIFNSSKVEYLCFNKSLGIWSKASEIRDELTVKDAVSSLGGDRTARIEKLKLTILQTPESANDRQISELEFELSLIFVNLRNGRTLNATESSHFERTLAIYALKLSKEGKVLKAKELIQDLKELDCEELVEGLLKPFFTATQHAYTSTWQDFITQSL